MIAAPNTGKGVFIASHAMTRLVCLYPIYPRFMRTQLARLDRIPGKDVRIIGNQQLLTLIIETVR